ncbi:unnamed protein product [Adineta ricciae]|uniref:G-protein coupled receptors family 1 profile domain-containing protein n=1 Tax=Adineta ricciae TaxID=249248 RepID=A0A815D109_ADIRI|nr:unnamed protein product [Adineta ricciae]CAF1294493.1 unnamed protein product [Adineta ricciae]
MNRTNSSSRSTFVVVDKSVLEQISHYIYAIVFPLVFLSGLIGNLFSSIVFSVTKLNQTSCGIYFLILALFDSSALIGGLHHCLTIGYHVQVRNANYCRVRNFLLYMSMDMASWMVVAISVDRYLKVKFPIKARMYATRKLAMVVSGIIAVIFIVKNAHLLTSFIGDFTANAADNCDPNPDHPKYMFFFKNIWPWIDLTTYALLPFVIVTVCNILIIYDQYTRRLKLRKRHLDLSLITLLLASSISLILCNLPITILAVIYPYISISYDTNEIYDSVAFTFDLLRLPSYVSLALNFYLYYYTSILFRQQTVRLFRRLFRSKSKTCDIELPNRIYTFENRCVNRMDSFDELEEDQQSPVPSITGSSFISNFYKQ